MCPTTVSPTCSTPSVGRAQHPLDWTRRWRDFLLSFLSFPRPCPWTGSRTWSPAVQPLHPRARRLEVAARPAHRTWERKGEWPVGAPQVWRPQSLSVTPSTTHSPPVGVRAEGLHRTTVPLWSWRPPTGPALLAPHPSGPLGPLPAGTKEADGKEDEGGP